MMSISLKDVAGALAHCDPEQHADALARAGAESIARATNALDAATRLVATFPRDEVVAEADALLYDVLRWPLSDGVPRWDRMVTPESFAARQGISVRDAQLTVERLHATEADAARALLATGPIANYTLEPRESPDHDHGSSRCSRGDGDGLHKGGHPWAEQMDRGDLLTTRHGASLPGGPMTRARRHLDRDPLPDPGPRTADGPGATRCCRMASRRRARGRRRTPGQGAGCRLGPRGSGRCRGAGSRAST